MAGQKLECRLLTAEDIPASAQIVFDAFNDFSEKSGTASIPEVKIVSDRLKEYSLDTGLPGLLYGGFVDGVQVAFVMLRKLGIDEEAWEISMLSVSPSLQRNGFGRKMVEYALQEILGLKGVLAVCAVTEGNERALELFAKQGFESEASGVPVGENLFIWMLRKDMRNAVAASIAAAEAAADAKKEAEELSKIRIPSCGLDSCEGCSKDCGGDT